LRAQILKNTSIGIRSFDVVSICIDFRPYHRLDPFPTCRPVITCPFPPSIHESITVDIKFEHLFSFGGNMTAIIGSVVAYSCVGNHKNNSIMIGDSARVCGYDGKWSGIDPICIHDFELNAELYEELVKNEENVKDLTTFKS